MAENFESSKKGDTGDIGKELQQSSSRKFESHDFEITENKVLSIINNSNENTASRLSQDSTFIILHEGNPLDATTSGCHADVLPNASAETEDAISICTSTSGVSKPLHHSKKPLCESSIEELIVHEHVETMNCSLSDKNEVQRSTSLNTTLNEVGNIELPSDDGNSKAALFEGSETENLQHPDIAMTMDNAEVFGFSNVQRNDEQQLSLQNSEELQNEILAEVACNRNKLKTSDSVYNLEGVAGPSRMNDQRQSYYLKDGQFFCRVCGKGFGRKRYLTAHCVIHTGKKRVKCDICGKLYSSKGNLMKHLLTHTGDKPFPCDKCERTFAQKRYLEAHLHRHKGEKLFPCDVCGKSFCLKSNLKKHGRAHTAENPYICPVCGQAFANKSNCNRRTKNKHLKK